MADDENNQSRFPLAGVIMCCTSIPSEERSELGSIAAQMGAINRLDLTSDVTHLIVGDLNTPKYKYVAKERPDIKCVMPGWIGAVRQAWMAGEETDVDGLERIFSLPTLHGLKICVTGFNEMSTRRAIEEKVRANGAEYRPDLTREVTHLIAAVPTGLKYMHARQWKIKTVAIEWLDHSLERGMILEESLYDPTLAPEERGRDAWIRDAAANVRSGKRSRTDADPNATRKLRRTASSKFDSHSDGLWKDIVERPNLLTDKRPEDDNASVSRSSAGAQEGDAQAVASIAGNKDRSVTGTLFKSEGIFRKKKFYLQGFSDRQTKILETHLQSQGGEVLSDIPPPTQIVVENTPIAIFIIVPHASTNQEIPPTQSSSAYNLVTDLWVEKCLHSKSFVEPRSHVKNMPFTYPISGFEKLIISSTAFEGIDLLHIGRIVTLLGAKYDQFFTPKTSILICNDGNTSREKTRHAIEWDIPAVRADWLWDCVGTGRKKPFEGYLIASKSQADHEKAQIETLSREETNERKCRSIASNPAEPDHFGSISPRPQEREAPTRVASLNEGGKDQKGSLRSPSNHQTLGMDVTATKENQSKGPARSSEEKKTRSPEPLHERCPNSPSKSAPPSPQKSSTPKAAKVLEGEHLSKAINTLLAHHESKDNSFGQPKSTTEVSPRHKKKRRLFGRATSNLSARSGSFGGLVTTPLSRASSVDTLNTDGVGTPLEPNFSQNLSGAARGPRGVVSTAGANAGSGSVATGTGSGTNSFFTAMLLDGDGDAPDNDGGGGGDDAREQPLQLTQVGYEDPETRSWHEQLVEKLGGKKAPSKRRQIVKATIQNISDDSVARRTRHAQSGRS